MKIPRCMSTQHPDNASAPFFSTNCVLAGEDEIREAYYAFSHLGCDEQMWDVEGKEIDTYVVKKLLSYYPEYFRKNVLGRDLRLTLRVPNPTVERAEAKILLETLESIPRSYDAARLVYGRDIVPIFEVILPMTTSARCIDRIYRYYTDHIIGRQSARFRDGDITIAEWIGKFSPSTIQVIPLFEDVPTMLKVSDIMYEYLADKDVKDQRVFLARSDTAMNYGLASAALANKLALKKFDEVAARTGVRLHPILGMGSAPFRGGLHPHSAERVGREYPSVVTFTIQSAFKFDYPVNEVQAACEHLKSRSIGPAADIDEEKALEVIERYSQAYRSRITELAPQICRMARYVPGRRARKLHVGQFGYSREIGQVSLPRAISFTCSMYSLGLPPELLAFESLSKNDLDFVLEIYPSFRDKIEYAMTCTDFEGPLMSRSLRKALQASGFDHQASKEHLQIVRGLRNAVDACDSAQAGDLMLRAALLRGFLG
ncbi:phosphoenolpyruvate carboxylase [Desulfonatronospira sp. MSAO_Bac3]|uniref:phosphoenolpyruvate carboxylase n=1 Tax=Desulfonatronospira sp. MSAO_Bac3 TaxID=2293857 RepID=UPI000FF20EAF|nr:phosphoenolpyruvate carboxylase [Desulfonatronospira sp. MSAO_Bac3]RQD77476.1 MAG: phosphoenolpyruvate carboxylase [Desulfonatronospira sp. MSAO_Bac3]